LIDDWRQVLVEHINEAQLSKERYPVRLTLKPRLRQVDFTFDRNEIRGLEQNPQTKSHWAQMSRFGNKVMQFLSEGRFVANVVDAFAILMQPTISGD
jgi:predicted Zn-ribbon and HTH transcriptional regulator